MSIDRDEFSAAMGRVYAGIDGINARLDVLNGRTRKGEERLAVLESQAQPDTHERLAVLESQAQPDIRVDLTRLETRINVYAAVFGTALLVGVPIAIFVAERIWR